MAKGTLAAMPIQPMEEGEEERAGLEQWLPMTMARAAKAGLA
jgi:hypothetical protein